MPDERVFGEIGTKRLIDNDQIRVFELKLEPGESSDLHRHRRDYVMVQIEGDRIAADFEPDSEGTFAGATRLEGAVRPGAVIYAEAGGKETAVNVGNERFREIIVEIKAQRRPTRPASSGSGMTVGAVIANAARAVPDAPAAVIDRQVHSFAELDHAGTRAARALVEAGGRRGDVLLALTGTNFDTLATFVGAARAGMVFAPLNPTLPDGTIQAVVDRLDPAVIVTDVADAAVRFGPRALDLGDLATGDASDDLPAVEPDDGHVVFFTSGSTGTPKAALLTHRTSVLRSHPGSQVEPRGPPLCPFPL